MGGIFSKIRAVTLGGVNDILDKAIDLNSPSMVRQYVRDLEDAIDKLQSENGVQAGQLRTLQRERSEVSIQIDNDKATIQKLQEKNAVDLARKKAATVIQNQKRISDIDKNIETQQKSVDSLKQTIEALNAKHNQMVSRVHDLERLDRDSKAKEQAAAAINSASKIVGSIDSVSVDDVVGKMNRRHDIAEAKFDQAMGNLHIDEESDADKDDVDALLAELSPAAKVGA